MYLIVKNYEEDEVTVIAVEITEEFIGRIQLLKRMVNEAPKEAVVISISARVVCLLLNQTAIPHELDGKYYQVMEFPPDGDWNDGYEGVLEVGENTFTVAVFGSSNPIYMHDVLDASALNRKLGRICECGNVVNVYCHVCGFISESVLDYRVNHYPAIDPISQTVIYYVK